jgi:hypothetical protein
MSQPNSPAVNPADYAEIALGIATHSLQEAAAPWRVKADDVIWLQDEFRADFHKQVTDGASYHEWEPIVGRLFRHAGAAAAFIAEARRKKVSEPASDVTRDDIVVGCTLVKLVVCPAASAETARVAGGPVLGSLGRICSGASFLRPDADLAGRLRNLAATLGGGA